MAEGIEAVREVAQDLVSVVNAEERLRKVDYALVLRQIADMDDAEVRQLETDLGVVDLNDDELEAKVKDIFGKYLPWLPYVMRILRMFFPKAPVVPV